MKSVRGCEPPVESPSEARLDAEGQHAPSVRPVNPAARQAAPAIDHTWLALATLLALVGVVGKWLLLPFPVSNLGEFVRWLLRLAVVSAPDVCFAAGLAIVCWSLSRMLAWWPSPVSRVGRWLAIGLFALCGAYAVASVPMFKVTKVPFTVRLLSFVGGPDVMLSSASEYFPPGIVSLLLAAPLAMVLAAVTARRPLARRLLSPIGPKTTALLCAMVLAGGVLCERYVRAEWTDPNRWERRIAQSPHWVLLASCVQEFTKDQPFSHHYSFSEVDDRDFRNSKADVAGRAPLVAADRRPKNVVLIVLESIGVEYVGAYGSRFAATPNLDRLAAERGVVFDNVYAQAASSCKSLVALSHSVYPRPDWLLIVRDHPQFDVVGLPQVLKAHGYRTCYAHSGSWGWQKRDVFLKARGVDAVLDAGSHPGKEINSWGIDDRTMYQDVLDWIDQDPQQPFYAYSYTIETHHPYHPPAHRRDFGVKDEELDRFLNALRAADATVAWFMAELEKRGLADSTLVAVTGDHGESFGQHNLRTHSFGIYEQAVHVPLVLLHPGLSEMPRQNDNVGRHIDVAPTLLDVLNVPAPQEWQGESLFRERDGQRAYFLSVGHEVVLGLRDGQYKYHYYVDTSHEELFDLSRDPREMENLATAEPERVRAYRARLGGWVTYQREFLAKHGVR
ncbi:MAG TPA: sulfatase-like hydrolase/transferase [Pirellulales bacterium]|nr:sulfatase-like hydrolase/transferase [Pirellulales bacterium]